MCDVRHAGKCSGRRRGRVRHTRATILLAAGQGVKVVQERLGHGDATTTLNYYGHVVPGAQAQAATVFAAAMGDVPEATGG